MKNENMSEFMCYLAHARLCLRVCVCVWVLGGLCAWFIDCKSHQGKRQLSFLMTICQSCSLTAPLLSSVCLLFLRARSPHFSLTCTKHSSLGHSLPVPTRWLKLNMSFFGLSLFNAEKINNFSFLRFLLANQSFCIFVVWTSWSMIYIE